MPDSSPDANDRFPWLRGGHVMLLWNETDVNLRHIRPLSAAAVGTGHWGVVDYPSAIGPGEDGSRPTRAVEMCRRNGVRVMATYGGVLNDAAAQAHPNWVRQRADGLPERHRAGVPICLTSPYLTEWVLPQLVEMFERWRPDSLWVDGDNWAVGPCYCPRCRERFRAVSGLEAPTVGPGHPLAVEPNPYQPMLPELRHDQLWRQWMAFHRAIFRDYQEAVAECCHAQGVAYTGNWAFSVCQPEPAPEWLAWITGDVPDPGGGAVRASLKARFDDSQGRPHDVFTWDMVSAVPWGEGAIRTYPKSPTQLRQEVSAIIAGGAIWACWSSRSMPAAMWPLADFVHERESLLLGSHSLAEVALLHSAQTFYIHSDGFMMIDRPGNAYLTGAHRALAESGVHFDIVTEQGLLERLGDYRLIVLPEQTHLSEAMVVALRDFAREGGAILATGRVACGDGEESALADLLGVRFGGPVEGLQCGLCVAPELIGEPPDVPEAGPALLVVDAPWQRVAPDGAEVLTEALVSPGLSSGLQSAAFVPTERLPGATLHRYGAGRAVHVACDLFAAYWTTGYYGLRRYVGELLEAALPERAVRVDGPPHIELFVRRQPGRTLIHLVNTGLIASNAAPQTQHEHPAPTGPLTVRLRMAHPPAKVTLEPQGAAPPYSCRGGEVTITVPPVEAMVSVVVWD